MQVVRHRAGVAVGSAGRVHDTVGFERDERIGVVGRGQPDGLSPGQFTGVPADLVVGMHPDTDEFEVRPAPNRVDGDRSDTAGRPNHRSQW